jgi:endonuclease/exonuclease/phosphatase family metal-dependent hydrolase
VIAPDGEKLQIINTHLGLLPQEQRLQAACLLGPDWLGAPTCRDPAVLLGDFNATPSYAAYKALARGMRDGRRAAGVGGGALTFPSRLPMLGIDHIFVSRSVEISGVHTPGGALVRTASDHLPLVADLRIRGRAAEKAQTVSGLSSSTGAGRPAAAILPESSRS